MQNSERQTLSAGAKSGNRDSLRNPGGRGLGVGRVKMLPKFPKALSTEAMFREIALGAKWKTHEDRDT